MRLASAYFSTWARCWFLRILGNGLCTAQRSQREGNEQRCRVGCPNEPDSLSTTTNTLLCTVCPFLVGSRLWCFHGENRLLHDLITHVFLRSLQYGIVVMGLIDAFVYAHLIINNKASLILGNFGNCMKGRIRFMTGMHSFIRSRMSGNMSNKTHPCSPASEPPPTETQSQKSASRQHPYHNARKKNFQGWSIYIDGCTRVVDGQTFKWVGCYRAISPW